MISPIFGVGERLRLLLLTVSVLLLGITSSQAADVVNTATYGRYGNNQTPGANWLYNHYDGNYDENSKRHVRMTLTKTACKVRMSNGAVQTANRILEESGTLLDGRFHNLESIYEYWKTSGECVYLGSDRVKRDGTVTPQERLGRGMLIPRRIRVGQTLTSTADYHEGGKFVGKITYSVKLIAREPVAVPAGIFQDCIQLRITIQAGGIKQVTDEWWAKGVGMVRRRGRAGYTDYYDLVAYNLQGDHSCVPGRFRVESSLHLIRSSARSDSDLKMVFPLAAAGSFSKESVTITNIGDGPLQFYSERSFDVRSYSAFNASSLPSRKTFLPGEKITFYVEFRPQAWAAASNQKYFHKIRISGDGQIGSRGGSYNFTIDLRGSSYFRYSRPEVIGLMAPTNKH